MGLLLGSNAFYQLTGSMWSECQQLGSPCPLTKYFPRELTLCVSVGHDITVFSLSQRLCVPRHLSSYVHVVTPGHSFLRLSDERTKREFMTLRDWDQSANGNNSDRKYWPSRIAGGCAWGWGPHIQKKISRKLKKQQATRRTYNDIENVARNWELDHRISCHNK